MLHHDSGIALYSPLVKSGLYQAALLAMQFPVDRQQAVSQVPAQISIELAAGEVTGLVDQKIADVLRPKEQHDRRTAHINRRQPAK
jgi:hypothetical protein